MNTKLKAAFISFAIAVLTFAVGAGDAYAYRCQYETCGCKAQHINCATSSCWYDSPTSSCSGHDWVEFGAVNNQTCPVCGAACKSWSQDAMGNTTHTVAYKCKICQKYFPYDTNHAAPEVYYDLTTVADSRSTIGGASSKFYGHIRKYTSLDSMEVAVPTARGWHAEVAKSLKLMPPRLVVGMRMAENAYSHLFRSKTCQSVTELNCLIFYEFF